MCNDNIYVLYGDNAVGKTRFLKSKIDTLVQSGYSVISNLIDRSFNKASINSNKLATLEENGYILYCNADRLNAEDISLREKNIWDMLISNGEYLILDELDTYVDTEDLLPLLRVIYSIAPCWKEIWIAGHSAYLSYVREDYKINVLENNTLYCIEGEEEVDEYLDKL